MRIKAGWHPSGAMNALEWGDWFCGKFGAICQQNPSQNTRQTDGSLLLLDPLFRDDQGLRSRKGEIQAGCSDLLQFLYSCNVL